MSVLAAEPAAERVLLSGISWATYERLLVETCARRLRLTYDRGDLEIMAPSRRHESAKRLIGRMIEMLTFELRTPIASAGSTTLKRELLEKGLEPDECYWITNEARVRGGKELDLEKDPPPDLAVEVDVTSSSLDRLAIYEALGVREVWRLTPASTLETYVQKDDGAYARCDRSRELPLLHPAELLPFLAAYGDTDETTWMHRFADWVRADLAKRPLQGR